MKAYINQLLFQNAAQFVDLAFKASGEMAVHDEVRFSIGAHVMSALVLEGIANEIGETVLSTWEWKKFEKIDTSLKWLYISKLQGSWRRTNHS
jgi:hypothetical protein